MSTLRVGAPEGGAAWAAAALAVAALVLLPLVLRRPGARRPVIAGAALMAAALSAAYVVLYLRGGPRIVDATTYLLEARALAQGDLAWTPAEPSASVAGRFLVRDALGEGSHIAGLFPPGWPAVLALGVIAGAPLAVGPLLAALVVLATAWLGAELVRLARATPGDAPPATRAAPLDRSLALVPVTAALLSAVCACLRYHTADTMSHGLSALLVALALASALRARADRRAWLRVVCGLALGWLIATRPVSGFAMTLVALAAALAPPRGRTFAPLRDAALLAAGALPGVVLLLLHQRAATGAWLASSQTLYYALADGPPGCFRLGFGAGVGCEHEHGAFVAANLPDGYGAYQAAATSLRRLKAHLVDPLNAEPLLALVAVGAIALSRTRGRSPGRSRAALAVALAPLVLLAAYAPFYFDGNYPGGGARFLADTLPVEHVLAAWGALAVAARVRRLAARPALVAAALPALALLGFALRASFDHALLRDREGGRPLFEAGVLREAGIERGLVFVDTDHGFAIGHHPAARAPDAVEVVRLRGDALDRMVWEARGRPPAFRYALSSLADDRRAEVTLLPFEPPVSDRVEGESLWPALGARGASAWPTWASGTCASAGRWLSIVVAGERGVIELALPAALADPRRALVVRLARAPGVAAIAELVLGGRPVGRVATGAAGGPFDCEELPPLAPPGEAGDGQHLSIRFTLSVASDGSRDVRVPVLALDALQIAERR